MARPILPPPQAERARLLLEEGMLATWVADDLGVTRATVYPIAITIPDRAQHVLAWQQVWAQIRRNPDLVALHREFNPT